MKNIVLTTQNPRQLAFMALKSIHKGAFADVALERFLKTSELNNLDRGLATELVYGSIRRMRTLDVIIDKLAKKKAAQQPPDLRTILHIGLYQLHYLNHIPPSAAVNTTVQLAKENGLAGLAGFVNGLLRQYTRMENGEWGMGNGEKDPVTNLGILHSYPDWIIQVWLEQFGLIATEKLCEWMNQTPTIDLRINTLITSIDAVESIFQSAGIAVNRISSLPQALRLIGGVGAIQNLPGFKEGWWTVQDCSAQLVSYLLDPQPGEIIIDACAAPGGKTTHIAELMQDHGKIWACDQTASRLRKLQQNAKRLNLKSIEICLGDSRNLPQFNNVADRVLLDAPCSGLGTLNRHADARWRQTPDTVKELSSLQNGLLEYVANWVKPGGILVYSTCTLHPGENESVIQTFLSSHPGWEIAPPPPYSPAAAFSTSSGWIKVLPYQHLMDGFFMVRLQHLADT